MQEIRRLKQSKQTTTPVRSAQKRNSSGLNLQARNSYGMGDIEDQAIAVNTVKQQNSRKLYNTEFLLSPEEGGENEKTFFRKLDEELNKVNTFYKDKVEEVINEASLLNKQMDALIAFRTKVMNPHRGTSSSPKGIPTDVKNSAVSKTSSPSRAAGKCINYITALSPKSESEHSLNDLRCNMHLSELNTVQRLLRVASELN